MGERLRHWPERAGGTAVRTGTGPDRADGFDWPAALAKALGDSPQVGDRRASAYAGSYLRDPALLPMMARLACDESEDVRDVGVLGMGMCGSSRSETFALLVAILGDRSGDDHRRGGAAAALGHLGDPAALAIMEKALRHRGNVLPVRVGAAMGIGLLGDRAGSALLAGILRDRREVEPVRAMAAAGLGMLAAGRGEASPESEPARVLRDAVRDPDLLPAPVRQTALLALGRADPDRESVDRLVAALARDPDAGARACAALALGAISVPGSGVERPARVGLLAALEEEAPDVRSFVLLGLGLGRHREARATLENALTGGGDPSARGAAAIALGLLGDPAPVAALAATAAGGGDPGLRASAAEALGIIAGALRSARARRAAACDALRTLAASGSAEVRGAACYGLGLAGEVADLPRLAEGLSAGTPLLRMGAILGLGATGGADARDRLLAHVPKESLPELRGLAIRAAALACAATPVRVIVRTPPLSPWLRLPE
ncbi:MAG: HEAT repeat domain-containing protein [Planctomycetales bacterium]|nr:HEAT repeat domain-containing protein [Planctomycetales bacterium]